jgi:hypothetical protein
MEYTFEFLPGFYSPFHPSIEKLKSKIKKRNEFIQHLTMENIKNSKRQIVISNLLETISEVKSFFFSHKFNYKKKKIFNMNSILNIFIEQDKREAIVEFNSSKEAECAVQLSRSLSYEGNSLVITFLKDQPKTKSKLMNFLYVEWKDNFLNSDDVENFFSKFCNVLKVELFTEFEFSHSIIKLGNSVDSEKIAYETNNSLINKTQIGV